MMAQPDQEKKKYLDRYIANEVVPLAGDVDVRDIMSYFEGNPHYWEHRIRFLETYIRIKRHIRPEKWWRIAETGALSGTSAFLKHDGYDVSAVTGDFRYALDWPSDALDLLISLEVFEHIKDQDPRGFDDVVLFNFSGVKKFVAEMWRVVKPGGILALSTPNACSLFVLSRLLNHEPPALYWPHVKEYPPSEVIRLCEEGGFRVIYWDTMYAMFHLAPDRARLLERMFTERGVSAENRGDVAFYVFQKPVLD